jgi:hypothetical protein
MILMALIRPKRQLKRWWICFATLAGHDKVFLLLGREFPYTHEISNDWAVVLGLFSK